MGCDKGLKSVLGAFRPGKKTEYVLCGLIIALIALCWLYNGSGQKSFAGQSAAHTDIESRMANTLSSIKGAGKVSVMITEEPAQTASGYDLWSGSTQTDACQRGIKGAIIVAQGAKDIAVRLELLKAAQTLLGIPASKVEVFEMAMQ